MMSSSTSVFIFLTTFLSHYSAFATATASSDNSTLNAILSAVTPTPSGWSSTTHFCYWRGVKCDGQNRVTVLDISSQSLSGRLPSFANLSRLRKLYLHNNSFTSIPTGAFSGLISLQILSLSNNTNLSPWPFPSELFSSPKMVALHASNANIVGSIPDIFRSFPSLRSLTLSYNNLSGSLPGSFNGSSIQELKLDNQNPGMTGSIDLLSGMNHLSVVWLNGNKFTGDVPASFVSLPNLSDLRIDESNNDFTGLDSFRRSNVGVGSFNFMNIRADVDNGAVIPPPPAKSSSRKKTTIVGAVVGSIVALIVIIIILAVVAFIYFMKIRKERKERRYISGLAHADEQKRKGEQDVGCGEEVIPCSEEQHETDGRHETDGHHETDGRNETDGQNETPPILDDKEVGTSKNDDRTKLQEYSYGLLERLTNKFDEGNRIGEGAFGQVYKGTLSDGTTMVAIKCLKLEKLEGKIGDYQYQNEIEALGRTNHSNLVKLLGYCTTNSNRYLVYEYMSMGSLNKWMFNKDPNRYLTWPQIKNIIQGIAQGLVHLHHECGDIKILHRDLKPANVVLDVKMNAKLCDFGLAKLLDMDKTSTLTRGCFTPGYTAPEVYRNEKINEKVDVHSFGIVMLELIFRTRFRDLADPALHTVPVYQLPELIKKFSPAIGQDGKEIKILGELAVRCIWKEPKERPSMLNILADIQYLYAKFDKPQDDKGAGTSNEKNEVVASKVGCKPGELLTRYDYSFLEKLTNKFDDGNIIEEGAFGKVYKGTLSDGTTMVAIKCLNFGGKINDYEKDDYQYQNEIEALGRTNHPNLVKLLGYFKDDEHQILVYEYMSNGSLDKWIFHPNSSGSLTWPEIKNVIQGIARGLVHLHQECGDIKILHRDLKPSNVVLDENKNAKLCDFGLAKLLDMDQTSILTRVCFTPGYTAPEVFNGWRINEKVDVYSFGIVMLELLFRTRFHDLADTTLYMYTVEVDWMPGLITKLSPALQKDGMEIEMLGELAVSCIRKEPEERPSMPNILAHIQSVCAVFDKLKARRNQPSSSSTISQQ